MKILANRKDEVLKRKAQYDADMEAYEKEGRDRSQRMRNAEYEITQPVQEFLEQSLSHYSALEFDISVDRGHFRMPGLQVRIRCNEHTKFSDDSALSWSYDVSLDKEGQVVKESSSWSGLKACTEAQMKSLRQTVSALEWLNDLNWKEVLDKKMPDYEDFFGDMPKRPEHQDFNQQLAQAEVEDLIGTNKIIKVQSWESCPYRGQVWLKILSETPSQYRAVIIPNYVVTDGRAAEMLEKNPEDNRIRKTSVKPVQPIEVMEV